MYNFKRVNKKSGGKLKITLIVIGIIVGVELFVQIVWPNTTLTPNTMIDDNNFGLWDKTKAATMLDKVYENMPVEIYFGDNTDAYLFSTMDEVGISASNARRVNQINYPAHWRLVPISLFWYGLLSQPDQPQTTVDELTSSTFLLESFDDNNYIEPINAGLVMTEQSIDLKKSQVGGIFSNSEFKTALQSPSYENNKAIIRVKVTPEYPAVNDEQALNVATTVSGQLINNLVLTFDEYSEEVDLSVETLRGWITFDVVDGKLTPVINERKLNNFLSDEVAPLVERTAGVTIITTNDLEDLERQEGDEGKVLNTTETAWRLVEYLLGKRQTVVVAVESIDPTVEYVYERISDDEQIIEDENFFSPEELEEALNPESSI